MDNISVLFICHYHGQYICAVYLCHYHGQYICAVYLCHYHGQYFCAVYLCHYQSHDGQYDLNCVTLGIVKFCSLTHALTFFTEKGKRISQYAFALFRLFPNM